MYPTLNSSNLTSGMGSLFTYAQKVVPFFSSLLFGFILIILTFGMYFTQETKKGRGDFPVAFSVGCTVTTILAGIMQMINGFLSFTTLEILITLTIISYIWLMFSD